MHFPLTVIPFCVVLLFNCSQITIAVETLVVTYSKLILCYYE